MEEILEEILSFLQILVFAIGIFCEFIFPIFSTLIVKFKEGRFVFFYNIIPEKKGSDLADELDLQRANLHWVAVVCAAAFILIRFIHHFMKA
ncbi:hypothetical protein Herbaro_15735 [Herbaspirillum sp. WKF16]|jgi:hypothetical protein|uniref:hypothetical protein n=1 Tax=Herbaspirillum sp. WKF16 TaxID=3028312 RepID=UPI0023A97895|nr:hypothetical protein [Herbaspirillum sp. WKF16]WDZ94927.1 hypothetical protein Herbaro_15735 [Herbaspirillum sp. WKF16]